MQNKRQNKRQNKNLRQGKLPLLLLLGVGTSLVLSACSEIAATKATLSFASEDRSFVSSVKDSSVEIDLKSDLFQVNQAYLTDIGVMVSEGRALVTGEVDTQEQADEVIAIVDNNPYIIKIFNHINVGGDSSVIDVGADMLAAKKISGRLLFAEGVTSANYKTTVHNGVAYVIGYSLSSAEKNLALAEIKKVDGLKKIVEHVTVDGL